MSLSPVAPDIWVLRQSIALPGRVRLPVQMTIVRLTGRRLWLHSPVALDEVAAAEVASLGTVSYLVAPNSLHHLFIQAWLVRFPDARLFASSALAQKRPDLTPAGLLGDRAAEPWQHEIDQIALQGAPKLGEVVFFHRATATLVSADLVWNVLDPETFTTGLLLRMMGTYKKLAVSRAWRRFIEDRDAFRVSAEHMLAWPIGRVIPGHGDVFEAPDARERLRAALWMLKPA